MTIIQLNWFIPEDLPAGDESRESHVEFIFPLVLLLKNARLRLNECYRLQVRVQPSPPEACQALKRELCVA